MPNRKSRIYLLRLIDRVGVELYIRNQMGGYGNPSCSNVYLYVKLDRYGMVLSS